MTVAARIASASTSHASLVAALLAGGGAPVDASFTASGSALLCEILGATYSITPTRLDCRTPPNGPTLHGTVYGMRFAAEAGTDEAFVIDETGGVYASAADFRIGVAPICNLADADPRAAIVAHLLATLPARLTA